MSTEKPLILVVDDSRSVRTYMTDILNKAGYDVVTAAESHACLAQLEAREPDVILLDIEMPGMNGLEVLDILHARQPLYSIIMVTSLSKLENRIEGLVRGADDYITKTFVPDELLARVEAAVRTAKRKKELARAKSLAVEALEENRRMQDRLLAQEKILYLAEFAGGLAHEINNPLGFIESNLGSFKKYADILLQSSGSRQLDKQAIIAREDLEPLLAETMAGLDRIALVVRSLRVISDAVSLGNDQVVDAFKVLRAVIDEQTSHPVSFGSPEVSLEVMANPAHLRLILEQLLDNAVDACAMAGDIEARAYAAEGKACIEVKDTGEGILPENIARVAVPFFTTRDYVTHFGLGLTVADCLVQANSGELQIRSQPGEGTTVTIRMPLRTGCRPGEATPITSLPETKTHAPRPVPPEVALVSCYV